MSAAATGACLCGAVTFEGKGAPVGVYCCHCDDCARWAGGPAIAIEYADGFDVEGPVRWYASSDWGERGFCERCGSAMFWRLRESGKRMNVAVGALDDRNAPAKIDMHIFIDRKPHFYDFADDARRLTAAEAFAENDGGA